MLPEEFPLVLTVFMVMGAWRMSRARVLTRRAAAIETLGAATVLCTDKTGTLTANRMRWSKRSPPPGVDTGGLLQLGGARQRSRRLDPMDRALAGAAGDRRRRPLVRAAVLRRELLAVHPGLARGRSGASVVATKGAPEAIAALCRLDAAGGRRIAARVERWPRRHPRARRGPSRIARPAAARHAARLRLPRGPAWSASPIRCAPRCPPRSPSAAPPASAS